MSKPPKTNTPTAHPPKSGTAAPPADAPPPPTTPPAPDVSKPPIFYAPVTTLAQARALGSVPDGEIFEDIEPTDHTIVFFKDADDTNMRVVGLPDGTLCKTKAIQKSTKEE